MSNSYYYFAASLPMIFFDSKIPMPVDSFLEQARRFLSEKDYLILEVLLDTEEKRAFNGNSYLRKWLNFNHSLHNELACFRAERHGKDPYDHIKEERLADPNIITLVQHAAKSENLLEAEKLLDEAKWKFLDELDLGHYFDFEFILSYGLKLKILSRYQEIYSDKGMKKLAEYKEITVN